MTCNMGWARRFRRVGQGPMRKGKTFRKVNYKNTRALSVDLFILNAFNLSQRMSLECEAKILDWSQEINSLEERRQPITR